MPSSALFFPPILILSFVEHFTQTTKRTSLVSQRPQQGSYQTTLQGTRFIPPLSLSKTRLFSYFLRKPRKTSHNLLLKDWSVPCSSNKKFQPLNKSRSRGLSYRRARKGTPVIHPLWGCMLHPGAPCDGSFGGLRLRIEEHRYPALRRFQKKKDLGDGPRVYNPNAACAHTTSHLFNTPLNLEQARFSMLP